MNRRAAQAPTAVAGSARDTLHRGRRRVLPWAALALGIVHAFSFAPMPLWWLQTLTGAALLLLAARCGPRMRLACGFAFGLGWFVTGLCWLYISMHDFGGMPAPIAALAVLLLSAVLALFPAVALRIGIVRAGALFDWRSGARFAAIWLVTEWIRDWLLTGFPWLASGYAHIDGPLAGWAPVIGVYGIGGLAALLSWCVASLVAAALPAVAGGTAVGSSGSNNGTTGEVARGAAGAAGARGDATPPRPAAPAIAGVIGTALLMLAGGLTAGSIAWTTPHGAPLNVRLIQGNIPQEMKFSRDQIRHAMESYAALIGGGSAQVTVLPETAWTIPWPATPPDIVAKVLANRGNERIVIGAPMPPVPSRQTAAYAGDPLAPRIANSMVMLSPAEPERILAQYDKRHLVPFGEFVPTGFGWFVNMMNIPLGEFARGDADQPAFAVADQRLAMNICYEDVFGAELLPPIRGDGATILVNASNIAWFGNSHALPQHLAIARMRARETGRPMLRATNTGTTASIDARGRTVAALPPYTVGVLEDRVQGMTGLTPFARLGNLGALLLAAVAALAGFLWRPAR